MFILAVCLFLHKYKPSLFTLDLTCERELEQPFKLIDKVLNYWQAGGTPVHPSVCTPVCFRPLSSPDIFHDSGQLLPFKLLLIKLEYSLSFFWLLTMYLYCNFETHRSNKPSCKELSLFFPCHNEYCFHHCIKASSSYGIAVLFTDTLTFQTW